MQPDHEHPVSAAFDLEPGTKAASAGLYAHSSLLSNFKRSTSELGTVIVVVVVASFPEAAEIVMLELLFKT